jgi:hypothetical protein
MVIMKCKKLALRVLSTAAVLSIVSSIAAPAFADVYDLTKGDISVGFKDNQQTVTQKDGDGYVSDDQGEIKDRLDTNVVITTKDAETDEVKTTDNTVTVKSDKGQTAKVTLEDVNIKSSEKAAMTVTGNGSVQLELNGKNTLDSSNADGHAGLEKNAVEGKGSLYIKDDDKDGGSLTATGGEGGAGIGGSAKTSDGKKNNGVTTSNAWGNNIVINGGTIDATGGKGAAGIGSGVNASGEQYNFWTSEEFVTITGGNVTATGGEGGAGIGGAEGKDGYGLYFRDGTIKATGTGGGAGIGGGSGAGANMVELGQSGAGETDLTITAVGSAGAAGIGGGKGGSLHSFSSYTGTTTATGGEGGAGIGSGEEGEGSKLYLCGGTLLAYGGEGANNLGNGKNKKSDSEILYKDPNNHNNVTIDSEEVGEWNIENKTLEVKYKKGNEVVSRVNYAGKWTVTREATCTEEGKGTYTATYDSVDGTQKTVTNEVGIPALGHDFGAWVPDGAGHKTRTCTRCNATETAADENYVAPKPDDTTPSGDSTPETGSTAGETVSYAPLRVVGAPAYEQTVKDGRVLIAVPAQSASLTGSLHALKELKAKGAEVLVFRTQLCESTVSIDTLLAQGTDATIFTLTHTEGAASLTVGGADHTDLLNK